jgi:hypothetical protein
VLAGGTDATTYRGFKQQDASWRDDSADRLNDAVPVAALGKDSFVGGRSIRMKTNRAALIKMLHGSGVCATLGHKRATRSDPVASQAAHR